MTHKVLLADDSLTIQKVIKITLANEPYVLLDCRSEADLIGLVERESPELVLLDFSLSESHSGYELCKIIRSKRPKTSVLMMYGTFDSVDENALKNCGAKGKIIKPFDSTKFINLCRSLIEELDGNSQSTSALETATEEIFTPREAEDTDWVVDAPKHVEKPSSFLDNAEIASLANELDSQMQDWGITIPAKIGADNVDLEKLPPKIAEAPAAKSATPLAAVVPVEETTLPVSSDLEYPDLFAKPVVTETKAPEVAAPRSKLVPLSDLTPASSAKELSFEESTGSFEISLEAEGTTSEEDIRRLEAQISDELEHSVPKKTNNESLKDFADLWAADEIENFNPTMKKADSPLELETAAYSDKLSSHKEVIAEVKKDLSDLSLDNDLEAKIKAAVQPIIEQMVKDYCRQTLEKVAWEVIPDLAENLIKKELQKISDSIIGE